MVVTRTAAAATPTRGLRPPSVGMVLAIVAVVAIVARLTLLFRAPAFIIADSDNYFYPGYQLARGTGFDLDLRRTPAYPLFIAFVVDRIAEDLSALLFAQHLLGTLTCLLVAWLGVRLYGRWTGLVAGLAAALSGPLLAAEHYVMAEALFIPLMMLAVASLCWAIETPRWGPLALGGILVGLASVARPIGLVILVALLPALLLQEQSIRRAALRALPAIAGAAIILLPWMARNAFVHGSFSADGTGGQTLVGRTMRHDRGFHFENPEDQDPSRQRARAIMREGRGGFVSPVRARLERELGLSEAESNRLMRDLALEAILRQPGYYVAGSLTNFARLAQGPLDRLRDHWATRREERSREEWEARPEIRHLLGPPSALQEAQYGEVEVLLSLYQPSRLGPVIPILALIGLAGLLRSPHRGAGLLIGLTAIFLLLASAALVAPLSRYRYPAEPLITLLAVGGITTLVTWLETSLRRRGTVGNPLR